MLDGCRTKECDVRNKCKHFWATFSGVTEVNNRKPEKGGCEDFKEFTEEEIHEIDQRQKEAEKKAQKKREELLAQKAKPRKG